MTCDLAQARALFRMARRLRDASAFAASPLPSLWLFTDPDRVPDPMMAALRLPPGSGVVYRPFGGRDRRQVGRALARIAARRRLVFLVGLDARLARDCGAHGVHLPERALASAGRVRADWPGAVVTGAAHSSAAVARAAAFGVEGVFLSPVFESASPSAGAPLGAAAFRAAVRGARLPVFALGGVDMKNAPELLGSGAAGIAAVSALVGQEGPVRT